MNKEAKTYGFKLAIKTEDVTIRARSETGVTYMILITLVMPEADKPKSVRVNNVRADVLDSLTSLMLNADNMTEEMQEVAYKNIEVLLSVLPGDMRPVP